jgi:hypothetical protein
MTITLKDRATARAQIAALLNAGLVGSGKPAQAVYAYRVGDFGGQSPIVVVTSDGSKRAKKAQAVRTNTVFKFLVIVFVVYSTQDGSWTESDAETRLDLLERNITEILLENDTVSGQWDQLSRGESQTDDVEIGGVMYRREIIPLEVSLYEN